MSNQWFPKVEDSKAAKSCSKQGAAGVVVFAAMNLLGAAFAFFSSKSPVDAQAIDAQGIQDYIVGAFITVPVLLYFAYRIYQGKGWLAAGLVLLWFITETGFKVAGGSTNGGWVFFYMAIAAMIINGLRGCWWFRRNPVADQLPDAEDDPRTA